MAGKIQREYPSEEELLGLFRRLGTITAVAEALDLARPTLQSHIQRLGRGFGEDMERAKVTFRQTQESEAPAREHVEVGEADLGDVRDMLKRRGLNVDEWVIGRTRVNEWGAGRCTHCEAEVAPLTQLRVDLDPVSRVILPARTDGWRPRPPKVTRAQRDGELVVFLSDQHAPHQDDELHATTLKWLRREKPDRVVLLGDLLDLDAVSRHRANPEWASTLQECIDTGYRLVADYVAAAPGARFQMLAGNHEDRLRNALLDNLRAVTGLTRPGDEMPVMSIPFLLRLDELEVEWVGSLGEYAHHAVRVGDSLSARHGWIAKKGSGASALATLDAVRHHVVVGHTHRQGVVSHTHHAIDGEPVVLHACEAGTLARTRGGLGYATLPDWQQGFATAQCWEDGSVSFDLARWDGRHLSWRGGRDDAA